ncbi:hypothetical protein E8D34_06780 [Nocardioides sp. GY 10113]|uniref:hypothetical protein n=1 Tax=Nocardioides sp. GY 10113 TaxID=2569761 RepID=UPI0010A8F1FA|nr:hypothetical protein [Nocardioides sp. GY 10113]TIC87991.1 hypothetical protein E8D34_06780 [Nocardioides sp. GY 10113]
MNEAGTSTRADARTTRRRGRPSPAARRFGYVVAVGANLVVLFLIHRWPGWDVVPFLSDGFTDVLPFVDASIVASIAANIVFLVRDTAALKAFGDLATTLVSLLALVRMWQVWPFDFAGVWGGWEPLTYLMLGVATFGTVVAAIVQAVTLVRLAVTTR